MTADGYLGTWVGVNGDGIIRSGAVFREDDEDEARTFVSARGLRPVRLLARNVRLGQPLDVYEESQ